MEPQRGGRYLSASEIGRFVYCPEAWFLEHCGVPPDGKAMQRLRQGSVAHRQIGRITDQLVNTDAVRRGLLIALVVLAVMLFTQVLGLNLAQVPL
jgi:hypothetical protein